MRPLRYAIVVASLAALLAACSLVTRIAYDNSAFAATGIVDDWFDLGDGQRDWIKERFATLLAWHRESELPAYERLLQEVAARAGTRVTAEDARRVHGEMRALYHRMLRKAIPDIADFLLNVSPDQAGHLESKFHENNARVTREQGKGSPLQRRAARAKRYLEHFEDWCGKLSPAQRDLVRTRVAAMRDINDEWMTDRRFRQTETLALIRSRLSREDTIAALTRLLVDTDSWRRPEYVAMLKQRDEHVFALIEALDATLAQEQRERLQRRIAGYAADVAYLMAAAR